MGHKLTLALMPTHYTLNTLRLSLNWWWVCISMSEFWLVWEKSSRRWRQVWRLLLLCYIVLLHGDNTDNKYGIVPYKCGLCLPTKGLESSVHKMYRIDYLRYLFIFILCWTRRICSHNLLASILFSIWEPGRLYQENKSKSIRHVLIPAQSFPLLQ